MNIAKMNITQIRTLFRRICRGRRVFTSVDAGGNKINITESVVKKIDQELRLRRRVGWPGVRDCTPHKRRGGRVPQAAFELLDAQTEKHGGAVNFLKSLAKLVTGARA